MARWSSNAIPAWTVAATADTTNLVDSTHHTIRGGATTQRCELRELYIGGMSTASAPTLMVLGRTSQIGTGTLAGATHLAAIDVSSATLSAPPVAYQTAATNKPQRHATQGSLVNGTLNAFGGIVRWYAGPDEVVSTYGNVVDTGELSLSAFTGSSGTGIVSTNIIFEVV